MVNTTKINEKELNRAEVLAEDILCVDCDINGDEKDCSSCEALLQLRDLIYFSKEKVKG